MSCMRLSTTCRGVLAPASNHVWIESYLSIGAFHYPFSALAILREGGVLDKKHNGTANATSSVKPLIPLDRSRSYDAHIISSRFDGVSSIQGLSPCSHPARFVDGIFKIAVARPQSSSLVAGSPCSCPVRPSSSSGPLWDLGIWVVGVPCAGFPVQILYL